MNQSSLIQDTAAGDPGAAVWTGRPGDAHDVAARLPWHKRFQQTIITIHRWIGIAACMMMFIWFISGVVLAYVSFPAMEAAEKLTVLPELDWDKVEVAPKDAIRAVGLTAMPKELRLEMSGTNPVYRIVKWDEKRRVVSAVTGAPIQDVSGQEALAIVREQVDAPGATLEAANLDSDQWTITGYWNKERPFHLIALNDSEGSEYYVSAATGEIVLDTVRSERAWNWLGAIPHWLYFEFLRHYSHEPVWTWTIYILAGAGIFVSISGIYIGISRLRPRTRYVNGRLTPFKGWMKWHHVTGIIGGVFLVLWITSGFLTMYPGGFLEPRDLEKSEYAAYAGTMDAAFPFQALPVLAERGEEASRASFRWISGQPVVVLEDGMSPPSMFNAVTGAPFSLSAERITEYARALQPEANVVQTNYIETGDEYWHSGFYRKELPMVRVKFDDPNGSWYHIDPETGLLTSILDNIGRIDRWSVVAIHDVDLHWLLERRPLWDIVLFITIIPGTLIVLTALIISYRRLQRVGALPVRTGSSRKSPGSGARATRSEQPALDVSETLVAFASQTGTAELLANKTADSLRRAGLTSKVCELGDLDSEDLCRASHVIFVVATTGDGDAPDRAIPFQRRIMREQIDLGNLRYAVLALGSQEYRIFCGFARALEIWLRQCGATPTFKSVFVHDLAPESLQNWAQELGSFTGRVDDFSVNVSPYTPWALVERRHLNPGSAGGEAWHLELEAQEGNASWQAGDIAQVVAGERWSAFAAGDVRLVEREFSIASIPSHGRVHLLVRKLIDPQGRPGVASGFLTGELERGGVIPMRLRENPSFHAPADDRPIILIGNGTGLAGLRGHLMLREELGHRGAWLIFGERNAATDAFYSDDVRRWQHSGVLSRADFAYSRDTPTKRYVQHVIDECSEEVRQWIDEGAYVYVCGSAHGMGPAVNEQLVTILGEDGFAALIRAGRYRRDVY